MQSFWQVMELTEKLLRDVYVNPKLAKRLEEVAANHAVLVTLANSNVKEVAMNHEGLYFSSRESIEVFLAAQHHHDSPLNLHLLNTSSIAMAAYAAVASLMNNIEQIMNHPRLSTSLDNQLLQSLLQKAASLLDFIQSKDHGGMMSEEAEHLERMIARAAHAAEDVIETHIVDQIHAGTTDVSPSCSLRLQQATEDMDAILKWADALRDEEQPSHSTTPMAMEAEEKKKTAMVGFEEELNQIMDVLTNQQSSRQVISIVGMGGIGKTTLARNIYQDSRIKLHFYVHAWATVSKNYKPADILSQLLGRVGGSGVELHQYLYRRRYLIILDDVWGVGDWDEVRRYLPDDKNGSRIVLTTRSSTVVRECCSSLCFTMKPLDEDTSWKLFCKKTFQQEICPYPELEKVGKKIARLCKGLPLSIVVIGGLLLKSPKSLQLWEKVVSNIKSNPNSKEKEESLGILSLSYNHLPPHLKPCFLYMGVFRENSEILVSKIIKLWAGEGFLRAASNHALEEIAEGYLKELIDRNLIFVKKYSKNGKIKFCGIHDLVRDLSLKVGQKQEFFHVSTSETRGTVRRILYDLDWDKREPSLARSVLSWYYFIRLDNHKLVRVCYGSSTEPASKIYEKVNLRCIYCSYATYARSMLTSLPRSVSLIWNLQTLIIQEQVVAPIEIWKMRQLRHIKCYRICLPDPLSIDGFVMMDNLQTLKKAEGLRLWEQVCKIIPNIKKLHLLFDTDNVSECFPYLGCLHKLESLSLSSYNEISKPYNRLTLPISLNKLFVKDCALTIEDFRMIGSLPQLQVLQLDRVVIWNDEFSFIEGQFLRLKFLGLTNLDLTYLYADSSHFPVLEKLVLYSLEYLEEIPSSISEIPTLELIHVERCSDSASISAIRIKEDRLEIQGNDALQVQVKIHKQELERLMKLVEREDLTIDNIHLKLFG